MLSRSKGSYLSFHSQQEKKNRFIHFLAKTFGKRQTIASRTRISPTPKPGGLIDGIKAQVAAVEFEMN